MQHLLPTDYAKRITFCETFLRKCAANRHFWQCVIWTDESTFTRAGVLNQRNSHVWSHENPHATRESSFQHDFRVNVWAGIWKDRIIGPFFIPTLTSAEYVRLLSEEIEEYLMDIPLGELRNLWFQSDGCPAHYSIAARRLVSTMFNNKTIGRGAGIEWPPRSPDLTPMDYFLWGDLKRRVYDIPVNSIDELKERILNSCYQIQPETIRLATQSVCRRLEVCVRENGGHIEHLLD